MSAFGDLQAYVGLPRVGTLRLSHDGTRLIAVVQTLNADRTSFGSALMAAAYGGR